MGVEHVTNAIATLLDFLAAVVAIATTIVVDAVALLITAWMAPTRLVAHLTGLPTPVAALVLIALVVVITRTLAPRPRQEQTR